MPNDGSRKRVKRFGRIPLDRGDPTSVVRESDILREKRKSIAKKKNTTRESEFSGTLDTRREGEFLGMTGQKGRKRLSIQVDRKKINKRVRGLFK
jgi:hypothetical protein